MREGIRENEGETIEAYTAVRYSFLCIFFMCSDKLLVRCATIVTLLQIRHLRSCAEEEDATALAGGNRSHHRLRGSTFRRLMELSAEDSDVGAASIA